MIGTSGPLRVVQFLLRDDDAATTTAEELVAGAAEWGANAVLLNACGISAWYPSRLPYQPLNTRLREDFVGAAVTAAHGRGMSLIARADVSKVDPHVGAQHPDWLRRDPAGEILREWDMPETCFTGDHWQRNAFAMIDELVGAYEVDAVFFNMYRVALCHCARCRATLAAAGVAAIPPRADPADPAWRAYELWRRHALVAYTERLRARIHDHRDAALLVYHHQKEGWDVPGIAHASDLVSATASLPLVANPLSPQPAWPQWPGYEAALGRGLRPDRPAVVVVTTSALFASRRASMPADRSATAQLQIAFQRGAPCPALPGGLDQDDPRALPAMTEALAWLARNADAFEGLISPARVALLASRDTLDLCPVPGEGELSRREEWGAYLALTRSGHPFDVVPLDGGGPDLSRYAVALLPDVACLAAADAAALDRWVASGGTLIATGRAGDFDERGEARSRSALACLGRPRVTAVRDVAGGYLAIGGDGLRAAIGARVVGVHRELFVVEGGATAREELLLLGPVRDNTPEHAVIPGSPGPPGLREVRYDAGRAWHLPWRPGVLFGTDGLLDPGLVLAWIVDGAVGRAPAMTSAPDWIEQRWWIRSDRSRALLLLLNATATRPGAAMRVAPLGPIDVHIAMRARRVYSLARNEDLSHRTDGDGTHVRIDGLGVFDALDITAEEDGAS